MARIRAPMPRRRSATAAASARVVRRR
jgi:hypothetical protein